MAGGEGEPLEDRWTLRGRRGCLGACRAGPCCGPAWRVTEAAGQVGSARGPQKKGEQQPARAGGNCGSRPAPSPLYWHPLPPRRTLLPTPTPLPSRSTPLLLPFSPRSSPGGDPSPSPYSLVAIHCCERLNLTSSRSPHPSANPPVAPLVLVQDAAAPGNYTTNAF